MTDIPDIIDRYTDWYGFDTENDPSGKVTLTALVHESGKSWVWHKAGELKKWCHESTGLPVVICHNLEYDLVNEFGEDYGYLQLNYLKGRLISARYRNVRFLDSFNHFRMSLDEIGKAIGITKQKMDIHSEDYVTTDALITLKVMTQARDYIATLGGQIGATSGSSAMSVWRHMTDDEYCTGALDTPWLRQGYYGGRVEIFRSHVKGNINGYDINSMYPYCMMSQYPEYLMSDKLMDKAKGMAHVTVSVPLDLRVTPLPWRTMTGSLWYPVGVFTGTWTYDELNFAKRLGVKILTVHEAYGCNSLVRPFDDFILMLYQKRKTSKNPAERLFLKVLMNSLYGKIASKSEVTRTVSRHSLMKSPTSRLQDVKWINHNRGLLDYQTPPPPYINVCWGAMITANARILLTKYMLDVPPDQLIYCDTDSLYAVDHKLPETEALGGMKLEKTVKEMRVIQPKVYQLDDFYRAKGVPRPRFDDRQKMVIDFARQYIEHGVTHFQAPIRFRASLNSHRGKANQWVDHHKSMKTEYRSKRYANGRYYPPVVGKQLQLGLK